MSETGFLAAICEQPDEDTPRLAFADWLDEHGQPVRAQFIRDQIELARMDEADSRYPALLAGVRRCGVFTDPTHRLECEKQMYGAMFRRGFINGWEVQTATLLGSDPSSLDLIPLEQLRLLRPEADAKGEGAALAARRNFLKVRTLAFDGSWDVYDIESLLLHCPSLRNLESLNINHTWSEEGRHVRDIIARLDLPKLHSLRIEIGSLDGNDSEDEDESAWTDWGAYLPANGPPLRRLHLDGSGDDNGEWAWPGPNGDWLTRTRHWPTLEVADVMLYLNPISRGDYIAVAPPGKLYRHLKSSRLTRFTVNGDNLDSLLRVADWGPVRWLSVHGSLNGDLLAQLFTAPQVQCLERLTLCADYDERHPFRLGSLPDLFRQDSLFSNLKHLSLANLPGELLAASFWHRLLRLDVGTPGLYKDGLAPVVGAKLPELRHLTVNGIRPEEALSPLFTATNMPNLCTIRLGYFLDLAADTLHHFATNRAMPHLSLIGLQEQWGGKSWFLGDGETLECSGVIPVDEDWWEPDPLMIWFW